jgi:hypothetical protein
VKVEVSDPSLTEALSESLRSTGCVVVRTALGTLEIRFGWPVRDAASGYELDGYLRVWEATHSGVFATRVG